MPGKAVKLKADRSAKVASKPKSKKQVSSSDDEMPKAKSETRRGKTQKKKKDPNAPKRGLSAYMFYANANRERVRAENQDISFGQVGKVLGEEWKALEPSEKEKYEEMARKDKIRYEEEKAKYNAGDDDEDESA